MGSAFGGTGGDPESGFIKFIGKKALKQDQIVHMEGKLQVILYFSREWCQKFQKMKESHFSDDFGYPQPDTIFSKIRFYFI